jgi:hypothetical protein
MLEIILILVVAIAIAYYSPKLTMFCGVRYIHPGAHRGYKDCPEAETVSWKDTVTKPWWDFRDIPVRVSGLYAHLIRLWWWLGTGTNLKKWASVHRHNHIHSKEKWKDGKPESRIARAKMYPGQTRNDELVNDYSDEIPNTWIDRNIYYRVPLLGPVFYFFILYLLLGFFAIIPWISQMAWLLFWRSESVNGYHLEDFEWNRLFHSLKNKNYYK